MDVVVLDKIMTLDEAKRIMAKLKVRRHARLGFFYDLEDLGCTLETTGRVPALVDRWHDNYWHGARRHKDAVRLRVLRTIPAP